MRQPIPMPSPAQVDRAIRLSYAQMMLGAVFAASTGGMFLIGFAMKLGADNVLLGLISTIPALFVVFQFLAAWLVERGISRKRLTVGFSLMVPASWVLIAAIPFFETSLSTVARFAILIGVISLVTVANQFAGNARGSWIGELVPHERRGRFFGYCAMFGGIVGAVFAVGEGRFLDFVQSRGLLAFTALFFFGALFGLAGAYLHVPQPDCPLPGGGVRKPFLGHLRQAFRNKALVSLALVHAVIAMSGIAGPFNPAYCLRDVGLSYFALGLINAVATVAALAAAPFWGKLVDRFGCRPCLILACLVLAPMGLVWIFIPPGEPTRAYWLLPWTNAVAGAFGAGIGVAISTLLYKNTPPEGRSVQFAAYGTFVTLVAAPMPVLGGWLVDHLQGAHYPVDLRITFYVWIGLIFTAGLLAIRLKEPGSTPTRHLVFRHFPNLVTSWLRPALPAIFAPLSWLEDLRGNGGDDEKDDR
jgi:MFS family permease